MSHPILSTRSSIRLLGIVLGLGMMALPAMAQSVPMGPGRVAEPPVAMQVMDKVVAVGQSFDVQLPANATTGYSWVLDSASSQGLDGVTAGESTYVLGDQAAGRTGAPGTQVFRFVANRSGSVVLAFLYRRPWSPDVDVTRAVARVTVQ